MEEARAVLARLDRIEVLEATGAPAGVLLAEVRALLDEAERWVRAEPEETPAAAVAIERCRAALSQPAALGRPIGESADSPRVKPADSFSAPPDAAPSSA